MIEGPSFTPEDAKLQRDARPSWVTDGSGIRGNSQVIHRAEVKMDWPRAEIKRDQQSSGADFPQPIQSVGNFISVVCTGNFQGEPAQLTVAAFSGPEPL